MTSKNETVLNYCLKYREDYIKNKGVVPDSIVLSINQFQEILCSEMLYDNYPKKPEPPIKRKTITKTTGLFFSKQHDELEYDHYAPNYLKALKEYEEKIKDYDFLKEKRFIYGMEIIVNKEQE